MFFAISKHFTPSTPINPLIIMKIKQGIIPVSLNKYGTLKRLKPMAPFMMVSTAILLEIFSSSFSGIDDSS